MIKSGHWPEGRPPTQAELRKALGAAIDAIDLDGARREVAPFVLDPHALSVWSPEFFQAVAEKVTIVRCVPGRRRGKTGRRQDSE
jgi:hypothetical protein